MAKENPTWGYARIQCWFRPGSLQPKDQYVLCSLTGDGLAGKLEGLVEIHDGNCRPVTVDCDPLCSVGP